MQTLRSVPSLLLSGIRLEKYQTCCFLSLHFTELRQGGFISPVDTVNVVLSEQPTMSICQ